MMQKSATLKFCAVCHFSESTAKKEIAIKFEEEVVEEMPKVELLKITKAGTSYESSLESESSYVVVDRNSSTLWIWKGSGSSPADAYKAGVETTKLKSSLRMYGASIKRVEEGEEPDDFPTIGEELKAVAVEAKRREEELLLKEEETKLKREEDRKRKEEAEQKRREEEDLRRKEEERKRKLEEEQRLKEEEERKRIEEVERKRREEEEERRAAEAAKFPAVEEREIEAEAPSPVLWKSVADATKPTAEPIVEEVVSEVVEPIAAPVEPIAAPVEPIAAPVEAPAAPVEAPVAPAKPERSIDEKELSEAISSLTLVRGVNEDIAKTLYLKANITTIMELSLADPFAIAEDSGLDASSVSDIVGNAKDLLGFD